jgi:hypothetical protein
MKIGRVSMQTTPYLVRHVTTCISPPCYACGRNVLTTRYYATACMIIGLTGRVNMDSRSINVIFFPLAEFRLIQEWRSRTKHN